MKKIAIIAYYVSLVAVTYTLTNRILDSQETDHDYGIEAFVAENKFVHGILDRPNFQHFKYSGWRRGMNGSTSFQAFFSKDGIIQIPGKEFIAVNLRRHDDKYNITVISHVKYIGNGMMDFEHNILHVDIPRLAQQAAGGNGLQLRKLRKFQKIEMH